MDLTRPWTVKVVYTRLYSFEASLLQFYKRSYSFNPHIRFPAHMAEWTRRLHRPNRAVSWMSTTFTSGTSNALPGFEPTTFWLQAEQAATTPPIPYHLFQAQANVTWRVTSSVREPGSIRLQSASWPYEQVCESQDCICSSWSQRWGSSEAENTRLRLPSLRGRKLMSQTRDILLGVGRLLVLKPLQNEFHGVHIICSWFIAWFGKASY